MRRRERVVNGSSSHGVSGSVDVLGALPSFTAAVIAAAIRSIGDHMTGRLLSLSLVGAQVLLIALLATPLASLLPRTGVDWIGVLALLGAFALAGAAFLAMRRSRLTIMPEPREGATLIVTGPYARIRHPMYSAVLLFGLGATLIRDMPGDWLQLLLLSIVMVAKARYEERLLLATFPEYASYRDTTQALVPGLY